MAISLLNHIDGRLTITEHPVNTFIRSAIQLQAVSEPKDTIKLYVGVNGIQYSGVSCRTHFDNGEKFYCISLICFFTFRKKFTKKLNQSVIHFPIQKAH